MNCKHKPASYSKLLTEGDRDMTCKYCHKPIRTKNKGLSNLIRRLLVFIPIILFCIVAGIGLPISKPGLLGCFFAALAISIFGWLLVCRFFLEYELVPEKNENTASEPDNP